MLIILEGPDGVGKTTLAKKLHDAIYDTDRHVQITMIHRGPPVGHPLDEYLTPLLDYRPGGRQHYILDRWHLGEYVYPRLTGRETHMDDATYWYISRYIRRLGGIVVFCTATAVDVNNEYRSRGDESLNLTTFHDTLKLFVEAANVACMPQVVHDRSDVYTTHPSKIVYAAQIQANHYWQVNKYITYVGTRQPEHLLLGDIRHGLDRVDQLVTRSDRRPAFMPYRATSGHWLLEALTRDVDLRESTALANARDVDDVLAMWRDLGRPKVVTLGKTAHSELVPYGIPHGQVPHPQFARRFHHKDQDSYVAAIRQALNGEDHSKWRGSLPPDPGSRSTPGSSTRSEAKVLPKVHVTDTSAT